MLGSIKVISGYFNLYLMDTMIMVQKRSVCMFRPLRELRKAIDLD
jgi:hypothetical protein